MYRNLFFVLAAAAILAGCGSPKDVEADAQSDALPAIFPDYAGVVVPSNMVAPRFWIVDSVGAEDVRAVFTAGYLSMVAGNGDKIDIGKKNWEQLKSASHDITVAVKAKVDGKWVAYKPFSITVSDDEIDPYLAYRLIEPGYETWNEMGLYQRCLESYDESPIITNRSTDFGCMNCHSYCNQDPDKMLFHLRVDYAGTYVIDGDDIIKLNTKTPETMSALVYPSWHPSGDYVAFSVNNTKQLFHTTDPNRIEVMDYASDVVVCDLRSNEILSSPLIFGDGAFETFPTFSPDGKTLYFCTADSVSMPDGYDRLKYNLCSIAFDPEARAFGASVDTIYKANADEWGSASFPRVSPDGERLLFTLSGYGTFSIWHHDADLYIADLATGDFSPVDAANSDDTESYHSWSSNGRWIVFSTRRLDGLYTRPFIAHVDADGRVSKPFPLPQPTKRYYDRQMKSYNVPEFAKGKVRKSQHELSQFAKKDPGVNLTTSYELLTTSY